MSEPEFQDSAWDEARNYVDAVRGLYIHAIVFAAVLAALFGVDLATGADWWVHWVLIGWGIGLTAHLAAFFLRFNFFGPDWEKTRIDRRLARLRAGR